jgi:hypothetical protein
MSNADNKCYESGCKKPNSGLLPVDDPKIVFLADKGQRVRSFARNYFALANEKREESKLGCTTLDKEHITYKAFQIAVLACLIQCLRPSSNSICAGSGSIKKY